MNHEVSPVTPERPSQTTEDNARKFTLGTLGSDFLADMQPAGFTLSVDWLDTAEDNETKLAYKVFDSGEVQILLIAKATLEGSRTAVKEKITKEKYDELSGGSKLHLVKHRYEFEYMQRGISFQVKYDEFDASGLRMLEVDAATDEERESFDPSEFGAQLTEVTGDMRYYGYRVAEMLEDSAS